MGLRGRPGRTDSGVHAAGRWFISTQRPDPAPRWPKATHGPAAAHGSVRAAAEVPFQLACLLLGHLPALPLPPSITAARPIFSWAALTGWHRTAFRLNEGRAMAESAGGSCCGHHGLLHVSQKPAAGGCIPAPRSREVGSGAARLI